MRLLDAFEEEPERIVSLSSAGTRGNPAVFPRAMFRELTELAQDVGGGAVIRSHPELLRLVEAGAAPRADGHRYARIHLTADSLRNASKEVTT
jgi:molybdenum cofactor cytidylyltransferase